MDYLLSLEEFNSVPLNYLLGVNALIKNNPLAMHKFINFIVAKTGKDPATVQYDMMKMSKDMYVHKHISNYNMNQTMANSKDIIRDFSIYIKDKYDISY